ncbi:MAG: hypothetical protein VB861_08370, partial [Planctomycetaceae bacterium]
IVVTADVPGNIANRYCSTPITSSDVKLRRSGEVVFCDLQVVLRSDRLRVIDPAADAWGRGSDPAS